jgi:hypothetical protein
VKGPLLLLVFMLLGSSSPKSGYPAAEEKPVLDVAPTVSELGAGWTTNQVMYLLDPRSQSPEIDYLGRNPSPVLEYHRQHMKKDGRTAYADIHYGRGNMVVNQGRYMVTIQRWGETRSLDKRWVDWKMNRNWIVRATATAGEDCFWTDDGMFQKFTFRRSLFHVVIEAGSASEYMPMLRLGQVIDAKIQGKPIPKI